MNRKLKNEELNRLTPKEFKEARKLNVVVVLDDIRSLNNVGSVFRTADAFLISKIYLCGITGKPPHRDIQKTALGATETVEWEYQSSAMDCVQLLKDNGYTIVSLEQAEQSVSLSEFKLDASKKYAIIFGNEVAGVNQELVNSSDLVVEIPQEGTKHSLNVSVSGGIMLWEVFKQLKN